MIGKSIVAHSVHIPSPRPRRCLRDSHTRGRRRNRHIHETEVQPVNCQPLGPRSSPREGPKLALPIKGIGETLQTRKRLLRPARPPWIFCDPGQRENGGIDLIVILAIWKRKQFVQVDGRARALLSGTRQIRPQSLQFASAAALFCRRPVKAPAARSRSALHAAPESTEFQRPCPRPARPAPYARAPSV